MIYAVCKWAKIIKLLRLLVPRPSFCSPNDQLLSILHLQVGLEVPTAGL